MKYDYHIIVFGAGSAGLVVANVAARLGSKVALIESEKMGGDCLNTGCVPSKSFLKCAHLAKNIRESSKVGIESKLEDIDLKKIKDRVYKIINEIAPHDSAERYESLGVRVIREKCKLIDKHTVRIGEKNITGASIVIATGSEPVIPPIKGLDKIDYLTNMNIFDLEKLPSHLIILGGGPIGLELGQGFRHLGSRVTIIDRNKNLFKKDDSEVAPVMEKVFIEDGIDLYLKSSILEVNKKHDEIILIIEQDGRKKEIKGDKLLVALGRKPVSYDLGLDKTGVKLDNRGYIKTDKTLRTNIKNIFACGDVTGPYQFTHMAGYQASIVVRNAIFGFHKKIDYSFVPWTTYTRPEVAHVGYTQETGKSKGLYKRSYLIDLADNDRAKAEDDRIGFLKLNLGSKNRIIGATLIGEKAGEMIPIVSLAIRNKMSPSVFNNIIFSYPTESEIFLSAGIKRLRESLTRRNQKLIKMLYLK